MQKYNKIVFVKNIQSILAMDPGKGMTNQNFPTEGREHLGALILGTRVTLFCYEAKFFNFDDELSKPIMAQCDSKFVGRAAIV